MGHLTHIFYIVLDCNTRKGYLEADSICVRLQICDLCVIRTNGIVYGIRGNQNCREKPVIAAIHVDWMISLASPCVDFKTCEI